MAKLTCAAVHERRCAPDKECLIHGHQQDGPLLLFIPPAVSQLSSETSKN
jgi:hypothetical protein